LFSKYLSEAYKNIGAHVVTKSDVVAAQVDRIKNGLAIIF